MNLNELIRIVQEGSADDVKTLLNSYGGRGFPASKNTSAMTCIDVITDNVLLSTVDKAEKQTLISDYINKRGVFGASQEITPDFAQDFRKAMAELTEQVRLLTEQVGLMTDVIVEQAQAKTAPKASRKATASKPSLSFPKIAGSHH